MARLKTGACMRRTLDREAHAASRLDVLIALGDQEAEAAIVCRRRTY